MRSASHMMPRLAATVFVLACVLAIASAHNGDDKNNKGGHYGKIRPGDASSIQAALDAARPGSTVTIPAGLYIVREPLIVRKSDITIFARKGAILECLDPATNTKADYAMIVRADDYDNVTMCPEGPNQQFPLKNFVLTGSLEVRNSAETAIYIVGVEGYLVYGTRVIDAGEYAQFPVCSKDGALKNNYARGCADAAFYVGKSFGCDIAYNRAEGNVIGIEVENTVGAVVRSNTVVNNTAGIVVQLFDFVQVKRNQDIVVTDNIVLDNNTPNFGEDEGALALVARGIGILVLGSQRVNVTRNRIENNVHVGFVVMDHDFTFLDPEHNEDPDLIDKISSNVRVTDNRFKKNGGDPDTANPIVAQLFGDIVYAVAGIQDNCFAGNRYKSARMLVVDENGMPGVKTFRPAQFNAMFPCA